MPTSSSIFSSSSTPIFVTGAAGFIGFHLARRLLEAGSTVVGIDNINDYYDTALKEARLAELAPHPAFHFERRDIADRDAMQDLFHRHRPAYVVHMAAQAGVRYSITNPHAYADSNLVGFLNILEGCRASGTAHLVYASSSSVYGANTTVPFRVSDAVDHPVSLYAATKKANELMAHTYSHLYGLPTTGLRFFTVYGPWGRPDMAVFRFFDALYEGRPIDVYNNGDMQRDFTFIDDVVEAVLRLIPRVATPDPAWNAARPDPAISSAPYRLYNIGNNAPTGLMDLIAAIEEAAGREAEKRLLPMQPGDVYATFADVTALAEAVDFSPRTPIRQGIAAFAAWYREVYRGRLKP
ncbi:NAD-dependent epimerase [Ancylobacter lacus]|uniref:NAD-dependent epimerase n=1 Tax=Ancylobacter lacus TaxID=2579970 RepID=UPI001BCF973E|nr:NAD-dependent epimerase [Ancylobacter lacus]MBS7539992.1 NAD-dependent epimerase [Ancylobacter lacus]